MHPYVHSSMIYSSQDLTAQVSIRNKQIKNKKSSDIFVQCNTTQLYFLKEMLPFAMAWMELEIIMRIEISQSEKDKYHMISFICGI